MLGACGCVSDTSDGEVLMADADAASAASGDPRLGDARAMESMVAAMDALLQEVRCIFAPSGRTKCFIKIPWAESG